jgi:hypothetical protein
MPQFRRTLDVAQGFEFKGDRQTRVGFLTRLELGGSIFSADLTCKDPTSPWADLEVVAVLTEVLWETGVTDAVCFSGQVSTANRQGLAPLVFSGAASLEASFQFAVYEHDPLARKYFLAFHSNSTDLSGLIEKRGDELNLSVADDPSSGVQCPMNYSFEVAIVPAPRVQALHLATSDLKNIVKAWGRVIG